MVACLPITGMVGGIIYLGVYNKTSNWAWRAGLMVWTKIPWWLTHVSVSY